jgi:hypothetical protein
MIELLDWGFQRSLYRRYREMEVSSERLKERLLAVAEGMRELLREDESWPRRTISEASLENMEIIPDELEAVTEN